MRIRRLDLIRYGRFSDLSLEFPPRRPDLHILFGLNEAGKSTALAAIEDLLFGFPERTPFAFRYPKEDLRVGGVLENGGELLKVRRRKGRKNTLLRADGLPFPEGERVLTPFLQDADRAFFTRMFGLDHERLHEGGREILEAKDDVGRMLFAAGAGLAGLRELREALASESDQIWAPRRASHRRYYRAKDRLDAAERALREHRVSVNKWGQHKRAYDEARKAYAVLERTIEERSTERRRLERIRRVYGYVRRKDELDAAIVELGTVPALSEDAPRTFEDAVRDEARTAAQIEMLAERLEAERAKRDGFTYNETLLRYARDIEQLGERRIKVRDGKADLPMRRAELEREKAQLRELAEELGWSSDDIDDIVVRLPARARVQAARRLLAERSGILAAVRNAEAALEDASARLENIEHDLEGQPTPSDTSRLSAVVRATRKMGDLAERIRAAEAEREKERTAFRRAFHELRPAVTDEAVLQTLPVPVADTVQRFREERRALEQRLQSCRERTQAVQWKLERLGRARTRIAREEGAVAPEELAEARAHRDRGWVLVRRHYVEGESLCEEELRGFVGAEGDLVHAYEAAVRAADELADRRFDRAQAAARLTEIAREIAEYDEELSSLRAEEEHVLTRCRGLDDAWRDLWSKAPFEPLAPEEMLTWLATREKALGALASSKRAEQEVASLRAREAEVRERLVGELRALGQDVEALAGRPLAVVLETAEDVLRERERAAERRHRLQELHRDATAEVDRRRREFERAQKNWSDWQARWQRTVRELGLDPDVDATMIEAQLNAIEAMRTVIARIDELRFERIAKIERDVRKFRDDVAKLVATVAPDLASEDPEEAVRALEGRLEEARRLHELRLQVEDSIEDLERRIDGLEGTRREARSAVERLQREAGARNVAELRSILEKAERLRRLRIERDEVLEKISAHGDGLPVGELEAECRNVDLDAAVSRLETIERELKEMQKELLELYDERERTRRAFEEIGGDDAAARAAAEREEALAEMRELAEQFVRVRTAAHLLEWAIERYRLEKQGPLLKRASRLFALITGGAFQGLQVAHDDRDRPQLVGRRSNGETVPVTGMSDGTADQLYFALRMAAVLDYLERARPLPFIADDLFVNFDDVRAAAGFRVLGELAEKTQVVFFTHHRHLVDIARTELGKDASVVELPLVAEGSLG